MTDPVTDPNENSTLPPADSAGPVPSNRQAEEPAVTQAKTQAKQADPKQEPAQQAPAEADQPEEGSSDPQVRLAEHVLVKAFNVDNVTITQDYQPVSADQLDRIREAAKASGVNVEVKE